ncbi:MAG: PIN domain-containing protein [Candidatus Aenigmatarchaeota archaeon]
MEIILDANILFAAMIKDGLTRHLILRSDWKFYIPEFVISEIEQHIDIISEKTDLSETEVRELFDSFLAASDITIIPYQEILSLMKEAEKISPDIDDTHYFALALKLKCPIWSNDNKLKEQSTIQILTTQEILEEYE